MFYPFSNLFMTSINRLLIILSVCSGRAGKHSSVRQMWGLSIYKAQQHGWLKCNNGKHKRPTQTKTSQSEIMVTNDHADFTALVLVATAHHRSHCVVHHGNRANMIVLQRRRQADRCIYISPIQQHSQRGEVGRITRRFKYQAHKQFNITFSVSTSARGATGFIPYC